MKWSHVRGNTWYIEGRVCIPVYLLNDHEAILLDSGYAEDRIELEDLLHEKNLRVRAVLGTHSHNDHIGNHAYFQEQGAEVILQEVEAAISSDFALLTTAYYPASAQELKQLFPHFSVHTDRTFSALDTSIKIDEQTFELFPLPGHTPGHTAIMTPDGVLYVGDAVLSTDVLRSAKIPSTANWKQDLSSKYRLETITCEAYLLAHNGAYADLHHLIQENISDRLRRAQQILNWLRERPCWTQPEVIELLWQRFGMQSRSFFNQIVFQRNAICAIEYLADKGYLKSCLEKGCRLYQVL